MTKMQAIVLSRVFTVAVSFGGKLANLQWLA